MASVEINEVSLLFDSKLFTGHRLYNGVVPDSSGLVKLMRAYKYLCQDQVYQINDNIRFFQS